MLIKPKRGQIIKASDIASISDRAARALVGGVSHVRTASGAIVTAFASDKVVRAKILDDVWTAQAINGKYWLAARAQLMRVASNYQWVEPPSNEPLVSVWWSLFGEVSDDYRVPVMSQYVHAVFMPDSGRYELVSNDPTLLPVVLQGSFNENRYAPAKFRKLVGDTTYATPMIYVYDALGIFEGIGGARGYVFHTYNDGHRYIVVQLEC